jgi:hypothetical protein
MFGRERAGHERMPLVACKAISTTQQTGVELPLMRILMTRLAVVRMSSRKGLTKRGELRLWLSEAGMARTALERVVRRFKHKSGVGVQAPIKRRLRANKRFMNRGMTMLA